MNSTTGDFSEIRKSTLCHELYNRGVYSSVKRQPRKLINLRPLNINGIKKEIEEGSEEDVKAPTPIEINTDGNDKKEDQELSKNIAYGTKSHQKPDNLLKDITNFSDPKYVKTSYESGDRYIIEKPKVCLSSNANYVSQAKEKKSFSQEQKNDSFDLDFSALSLSTPVKENDFFSRVSFSSNAIKPEHYQQFVTPKINNALSKNQGSLLKRSFLKTPLNSLNNVSAKKLVTPTSVYIYKPVLQHKIAPPVPEDQAEFKNVDTRSNTFPNYLKDKITSPSHNISTKLIEHEYPDKTEDSQWSASKNSLRDGTFKRITVNNIEYIIFNLIGKGGSSEVYQCYNLENRLHVAIKCVSLHNSSSANGYINEVKLLQQLQSCEKIIKMYDYEISESQKKLLVVLENGGKDLSTILKQLAIQKSHIPVYMLLFYWMEMLHAVKQMHSHGIIHSDLKPANFLKVDEGLKLIDFGIASSVQSDMTSVIKTKQEGSCNYISPEALNCDSSTSFGNQKLNTEKYKIHYKSDVWSLGCILYQFVYRRTPFQHISQLWPKLAAIMNPEHKIDYPDVEWISPKIISTIRKCLQYNVKSRPSVDELIAEYETILHNI